MATKKEKIKITIPSFTLDLYKEDLASQLGYAISDEIDLLFESKAVRASLNKIVKVEVDKQVKDATTATAVKKQVASKIKSSR